MQIGQINCKSPVDGLDIGLISMSAVGIWNGLLVHPPCVQLISYCEIMMNVCLGPKERFLLNAE